MTIESIRVKDLVDFETDFRSTASGQHLSPITYERAKGQVQNPNASADDVGLLIARRGSLIIGHLSLLPGVLAIAGEWVPIIWTNAFYVLPEFRKSTAALQLVKKATSLGKDVFVTGFNEPSRLFCEAIGFGNLPHLNYLKFDLRSVDLVRAVVAKLQGARKSSPELGVWRSPAYQLLRDLYLRWQLRSASRQCQNISFRKVEYISPLDFESPCDRVVFERDVATVNWMLNNPWIRESQIATQPPYYFSDNRVLMRYEAVEFHDDKGNYVGFATFLATQRDNNRILKLLDFQAETINVQWAVLAASLRLARSYEVDQILLHIDFQNLLRNKMFLRRNLVVKKRGYQWMPTRQGNTRERLANYPAGIQYAYPDGDCAFG